MQEPVRPEAVLPARALYLPTFSHFLIVNKSSLYLSLSLFSLTLSLPPPPPLPLPLSRSLGWLFISLINRWGHILWAPPEKREREERSRQRERKIWKLTLSKAEARFRFRQRSNRLGGRSSSIKPNFVFQILVVLATVIIIMPDALAPAAYRFFCNRW